VREVGADTTYDIRLMAAANADGQRAVATASLRAREKTP